MSRQVSYQRHSDSNMISFEICDLEIWFDPEHNGEKWLVGNQWFATLDDVFQIHDITPTKNIKTYVWNTLKAFKYVNM